MTAKPPPRRWHCGPCNDGNCGQCRRSIKDAMPPGKDGDRTAVCACLTDGHPRAIVPPPPPMALVTIATGPSADGTVHTRAWELQEDEAHVLAAGLTARYGAPTEGLHETGALVEMARAPGHLFIDGRDE